MRKHIQEWKTGDTANVVKRSQETKLRALGVVERFSLCIEDTQIVQHRSVKALYQFSSPELFRLKMQQILPIITRSG